MITTPKRGDRMAEPPGTWPSRIFRDDAQAVSLPDARMCGLNASLVA